MLVCFDIIAHLKYVLGMNRKLVYAYLRTSNQNTKSAKDGDSRDRQLKKIKSFVRSKGWKVEQVFYDLSVSGDTGADLSERDEWNEMFAKMISNGIKTFVVADQMRFSRSILTAEVMKADCRENGISAFDASTGNDLTINDVENPEIDLINNVMQAIAKYDKLKVVQRLQSGRRKAMKMGKSVGGQSRLGKNEQELKMIERIKELRFPNGQRRISLQKIADKLNDEGFQTRRGGLVQVIQVRNVLAYLP